MIVDMQYASYQASPTQCPASHSYVHAQHNIHLAGCRHSNGSRPIIVHVCKLVGQPGEGRER